MSAPVPNTTNTTVVIVTYDDRAHLLEPVVAAALDAGIAKIIVVDNASVPDSAKRIQAASDAHVERLTVVRTETNLGSAGGFKLGLESALALPGVEFLWLLDDDNKPLPNAFEELSAAYHSLGAVTDNTLVSLRPARVEYLDAAETGRHAGIVPNSFLRFHIKDKLWNRTPGRNAASQADSGPSHPLVPLAYAPFGGLLLHRSWLSRVGLPNEKFFLYSDDHEFTMRILESGGHIYLCAASRLEELETSWGDASGSAAPVLMRQRTDERKVYYFVRNRTYLEATRSPGSLVYWLNVTLCLVGISIKGLVAEGKPGTVARRLILILRALKDGRDGAFSH